MKTAITGVLAILLGMAGAGGAPAVVPRPSSLQRPGPPGEQRVDINHATLDELLKVPGMTRTWAGRIVRFRPYRSKQDLLDGGIVSGEVYNRIKDYIIAHREKQ